MDSEITEKKGSKKLLIGILLTLIVILIGLAVYLYFNKPEPKNIYLRAIDTFASEINKNIDKMPIDNKQNIKFNFSLNLTSNNKEYKDIAKIINNIKLSSEIESDFVNRKANMNLDVLYNNSSVVEANMYLNNSDLYAELPSLFDKLIKIPGEEGYSFDTIWNTYDKQSQKTIINELTNIIKNNLEEEFFSNSEEKINVLGSEVNIVKYTLKMSAKEVEEFRSNIYNDILNNSKLLNALSKTSSLTLDEVKEVINTSKDNLEESEDIKIDISLNKKNYNVENVLVVNGGGKLELVKTSENKFDIKYNEEKLGTIMFNDKTLELNIEYDGVKLKYTIKESKVEVEMNSSDMQMILNLNGDEKKGTIMAKVTSLTDKVTIVVNGDYEISNIKSITSKDYSNYVELENLTEKDYEKITTSLYKNQSLMTLIQDVTSLYSNMIVEDNSYVF